MKTTTKDLKAIIKIQEKIIKANAASARIYKTKLKESRVFERRALDNWLTSLDLIAGLDKDKQNIWNQRNEAVRDYNAIHKLASYAAVPPLKHYDLPENMELDPSKEYDFKVKSSVLESGQTYNQILVFPKSQRNQDLKKKSKKRKNSYEKSK